MQKGVHAVVEAMRVRIVDEVEGAPEVPAAYIQYSAREVIKFHIHVYRRPSIHTFRADGFGSCLAQVKAGLTFSIAFWEEYLSNRRAHSRLLRGGIDSRERK